MIAHRLSTIRRADRVVVLEPGQMVGHREIHLVAERDEELRVELRVPARPRDGERAALGDDRQRRDPEGAS